MTDDYREWLARAKSSMAIAKHKQDESIFYEDLCFQAQQAVEKAIKGFLIFFTVEPERTHNLVPLIKELSKQVVKPKNNSLHIHNNMVKYGYNEG